MKVLVVYVGQGSHENYNHGLRNGAWGFKANKRPSEKIEPGDYILFGRGFTGGSLRQGRARPSLRILPLAVRQRRGQEGRRVLHAALRGQAAGRDARALPRPGVRPLLWLVGHEQARVNRLSILAPSDNAIGLAPPQSKVTREP